MGGRAEKIDIDFINEPFSAYHTGLKPSIEPREGPQGFEITPNAVDLMLQIILCKVSVCDHVMLQNICHPSVH